MRKRKLHDLCKEIIRYYPPVVASLMCLHIILLLFGCTHWAEEIFFDSSLFSVVLLTVASYAFEFCVWHRLTIFYSYAVSVCIDYQRNVGFEHLTFMRLLMLFIGLAILVMFIIRCITRKARCNQIPL